ncbi:MAG: FecR domain-containing protein, partial [Candidatus Saccharicenans sp.]|nr:FecR domain-containing protein [Candidatus Saccharicenans sp.]
MRKILFAIFIPALVCLLVSAGGTTGKHYTLISGERDLYYGFISYLPEEIGSRAPEVIRDGLKPEPVRLNFPVGPGDLIVTYDRPCEIQFDSGTILRLDTDTRLRIETIMAQSLSSEEQMSNLWLERGQAYLMYTAYNSWEVFQLLTPNAAIKMKNKSVLIVRHTGEGETWLTVKEGKVSVLYGPSASRLSTVSARKGVSLVVDASDQVSAKDNFPEFAQFEAWNAGLNKKFLELHRGITPLPKPVQKLPPAVFYFAQYYGNRYGEWVWDDYLGYVWRPFYNDLYPWGNWSPYFYGSWTYLNGQLFWVPEEPWGWVPYHLGIWHWDKKKGWVWIPGSVFAPAWAVWDFYAGYYTWRPWFLYDWLGLYGYDYN